MNNCEKLVDRLLSLSDYAIASSVRDIAAESRDQCIKLGHSVDCDDYLYHVLDTIIRNAEGEFDMTPEEQMEEFFNTNAKKVL